MTVKVLFLAIPSTSYSVWHLCILDDEYSKAFCMETPLDDNLNMLRSTSLSKALEEGPPWGDPELPPPPDTPGYLKGSTGEPPKTIGRLQGEMEMSGPSEARPNRESSDHPNYQGVRMYQQLNTFGANTSA